MEKKLYRSRTNKTFAGVCGGLGDYLNIDATLIRVLWALLSFVSVGTGLVVYIVMACIIPEAPEAPWQPPYQAPPQPYNNQQNWQQPPPPQNWQTPPPQGWQPPPAAPPADDNNNE